MVPDGKHKSREYKHRLTPVPASMQMTFDNDKGYINNLIFASRQSDTKNCERTNTHDIPYPSLLDSQEDSHHLGPLKYSKETRNVKLTQQEH